MIPKVIHYCWFGHNPKPKLAMKCIESWKKCCPGYEIIEWNEENFDVTCIPYVKEAYEKKKYAFVTDYVRLKVLYEYGGIYMDTDVETIKSLDDFLMQRAFSGFELPEYVPTGIMAAERSCSIIQELLHYYSGRHFVLDDGSMDLTTNTKTITSIMNKKGLVLDGTYQVVDGFAFYPMDFFCPLEQSTGRLKKTKNTVTIHWYSGSWRKKEPWIRTVIVHTCHRMFGNECFRWLKK